ncbi:MAG: hypothetical protein AAFV07_18950 [Bacteroidota bacterium]
MVEVYIVAGIWVLLMLGAVPFYAKLRGHPPMRAGLRLLLLWGFCWVIIRTWLLREIEGDTAVFARLMQQVVGWTILAWTLCFGGILLYLWRKPAPDILTDKLNQIGQQPDR